MTEPEAPPEQAAKPSFFDSTVAITAHNAVAVYANGPQPFEKILAVVRTFFGKSVAVDPEQMLACLKMLEDKKFMVRTDDGWDVTDPDRRALRRHTRPNPEDPGSGWDGLELVKVKLKLSGDRV